MRTRGWATLVAMLWLGCGSEAAPVDSGTADSGARPDGGANLCEQNAACDDGVFCNGAERCPAPPAPTPAAA